MPTKQKKQRSLLVGMELEVNFPHRSGVPRATIAAIEDDKLLAAKHALARGYFNSVLSPAVHARIHKQNLLGEPLSPEDETLLLSGMARVRQALGGYADELTLVHGIVDRSYDYALRVLRVSAPEFALSPEWAKVEDGSAGAEFKLLEPEVVSLDEANIDPHIERLLSFFDKWGFKTFSNAGTHVHLGIQAWAAGRYPSSAHKQRAATMLAAAFMLSYEHVIFKLMPSQRQRNQYCPRNTGSEINAPLPAPMFGPRSSWPSSYITNPLAHFGMSDSESGAFISRPADLTTGNNVADWILHPVFGSTFKNLPKSLARLIDDQPTTFGRWQRDAFACAVHTVKGALNARRAQSVAVSGSLTSSSGYDWLALSRHLPTFEFRIFPGTNNPGLLKGYARLAIQLLNAVDTALDRDEDILDFSIPWKPGAHPLFRAPVHDLKHLITAVSADTNLAEWLLKVSADTSTTFDPFTKVDATPKSAIKNNAPAKRRNSTARSPECVAA